jgi:hypothetical protein
MAAARPALPPPRMAMSMGMLALKEVPSVKCEVEEENSGTAKALRALRLEEKEGGRSAE